MMEGARVQGLFVRHILNLVFVVAIGLAILGVVGLVLDDHADMALGVLGIFSVFIVVGVVGTRVANITTVVGAGLVLAFFALSALSLAFVAGCWDCGREGTDGLYWSGFVWAAAMVVCVAMSAMALPAIVRFYVFDR